MQIFEFKKFLIETNKFNLNNLDYELNAHLQKSTIFEDSFWEFLKAKCIELFEGRGFSINYQGRNRLVFLSPNKNVVIKVPVNTYGIDDNYPEFQFSSWKN